MYTQTVPKSGTALDVAEWRCLAPANAINRVGQLSGDGKRAKLIHISGFIDFLNPVIQDLVMPCDVIVLQRNLVHQAVFDSMQYFQGMGKPVVVDLDDAYQMLPWSNPAHRFWVENPEHMDPPPLRMLEMGLSLSDGLLAPNRNLLHDWSHVARGYYMPNFARREWWENLPSRQDLKTKLGLEDRIIIGWGGSVSHYDSWWGSGLREAAHEITRRHPEVLWMICGNDPRIFEHLPVSIFNKYLQPGVPPDDWPRIVKSFDIGVAPLFGEYDQRRSWIKGLEYTLAGVPWVGTAGEPYRDIQQLGHVIPNSVDHWEGALERTIKDLKHEQEAAEAKIRIGQNWFADTQVPYMEQVYGQIRRDFDASKGRLPGLVRVAAQPAGVG